MIKNLDAERYLFNGLWFWKIRRDLIDDATGKVDANLHVLPEDAITIRAAEYRLDPSDPHLALDLILHEALILNPPTVPYLVTAPTIDDARAAHQGDVDGVRARFGHGPMPRARAARDVVVAQVAAQVDVDLDAYLITMDQVWRTRVDRLETASRTPRTQPPLHVRLAAQERRR